MYKAATARHSLTRAASATARLTALTNHLGLPVTKPHIFQHTRTMASLPKTMKGIQISKTGGVDVLEWKTDIPVPEPKAGEVLVKNDFIGVNFIDT